MKVRRQSFRDSELADGHASVWAKVEENEITLVPSPVALTESVSPYLAKSSGHGSVQKISVRMLHNGTTFGIRIAWLDPDKDDVVNDLDQFPDGLAVMFPLRPGASAITMGSVDKPVNAWLWKADEREPFDVFARGYATSERRQSTDSDLKVASYHEDGRWTVVFQRRLDALGESYYSIIPGAPSAVAFAVWEGSNNERSAQKSVSGEFMPFSVDT